MNVKRSPLLMLAFCGIVGFTTLASAAQKARAISAPGATIGQLTRAVFSRQGFQVAIPHRGIIEEMYFSLVPPVSACGELPQCNYLHAYPTCAPGCPQGYCYCGCNQTGCTPYFCREVGFKSLCTLAENNLPGCPHPCEGDYNSSCQDLTQ